MKTLLSILLIFLNIIINKSFELDDETLFKLIKQKSLKLNFLEDDSDDEKSDKDLSFEEILTKKG